LSLSPDKINTEIISTNLNEYRSVRIQKGGLVIQVALLAVTRGSWNKFRGRVYETERLDDGVLTNVLIHTVCSGRVLLTTAERTLWPEWPSKIAHPGDLQTGLVVVGVYHCTVCEPHFNIPPGTDIFKSQFFYPTTRLADKCCVSGPEEHRFCRGMCT
jgi:hypothetical protein